MKEIPHKVLHFASAWWREKTAAIRQEHIFVKILFAITILHLLYSVFLLSVMLLGMNHPLACDIWTPGYPLCADVLNGALHSVGTACSNVGVLFLRVFLPVVYAPIYLIIVYILDKITGYGKVTLLNCIAVYFIFSIVMLVVMLVGGYIIGYLFIEILPSVGEIPALRDGRPCHWDYNSVAPWLLMLLLLVLCCFGIVRRLYPDNIFMYRCIYGTMAMFWFVSIGVMHMVLVPVVDILFGI